MWELPLMPMSGRSIDVDAAAGALISAGVVDDVLADLAPSADGPWRCRRRSRDRMFLSAATLSLSPAERRLDRDQRLDLVGPRLSHLEAERAGLAVHQHDAGADLVDQLDIGGDDLRRRS